MKSPDAMGFTLCRSEHKEYMDFIYAEYTTVNAHNIRLYGETDTLRNRCVKLKNKLFALKALMVDVGRKGSKARAPEDELSDMDSTSNHEPVDMKMSELTITLKQHTEQILELEKKNSVLQDLLTISRDEKKHLQLELEKNDRLHVAVESELFAATGQITKLTPEPQLRTEESSVADPMLAYCEILDIGRREIWRDTEYIIYRAITRMCSLSANSTIKYPVFIAGIERETYAEHHIDKRHIYTVMKGMLRQPVSRGECIHGLKMNPENS